MRIKEKLKLAWRIFGFFFKIGFFTYGGGWSIIAQMEKEFIEKEKWLSKEELLDIVSVGRSLPGLMIGNVSLIFGYRMGGVVCAVAAVLGIVCPSLIVLMVVTYIYEAFRDNTYVARAMLGIRAAIAPIIGSAGIRLMSGALKDRLCYVIMMVAFVLCAFTSVNIVWIIIGAAIVGLLLNQDKMKGERDDTGIN
ncbi:MAG: chromate transporter [Lachnospiraceae bacterium]|nr:chromate transporter [Lachnospiraceae bacterium]